MTEHSLIIRFGFTCIDNKMVSVKFPNPFRTDPLLQYMYDIKSNTALIFSALLGFLCLVLFSGVFFPGQPFHPNFPRRTGDATLKLS